MFNCIEEKRCISAVLLFQNFASLTNHLLSSLEAQILHVYHLMTMYMYIPFLCGSTFKQTEDEYKLNSNVWETEEKFKYKLPAVTARILHSAD